MKIDTIDSKLFLEHFSDDKFRNSELEMSNNKDNETQNSARLFFNNPIEFNPGLKKLVPEKILEITDIYPPNICVIDFILKNNFHSDKEFSLLDYGCGVPNLIYCLKKIGVKNLFGYDNWTQIEKEYAEKYLSLVGLKKNILLDEEAIYLSNTMAVSNMGCAIRYYEFLKLASSTNLKYIFSDYRFSHKPVEANNVEGLVNFEQKRIEVSDEMLKNNGFYPEVVYNGLLIVYKRA